MVNGIACVGIVLVSGSLGAADDWPGWRGPGRLGEATGFQAPRAWPDALREVWSAEVGEGHATPVLVGQRLFVFTREGEEEVLRSFELGAGKALWRQSYPAPYKVSPHAVGHGAGPKSTPELQAGRIVTLGISGILSCFGAETGKRLWQRDFARDFPTTSPLYGTAQSPLIAGSLVIAHVGGHDRGAIRAFDLDSGHVRWSVDGDGPAYASPVAAELGGVRQIVAQTQSRLLGVSLDEGKVLWHVPFTTEYDQNSVTPVVWKDLVIYSGYMTSTAALQVLKGESGLTVREAWSAPDVPMFMSSPVLQGETLCGMSQKLKGHLFRLDPATGKVLWKGPGRLGENASLVAAGKWLLALTDAAQLQVHEANESGLTLRKTYTVAPTPTWAHLVAVGDRLVIKDKMHVRVLVVPGS